jgi:copper chaperone CopZ
MTQQFKTNINCSNCVRAVTNFLNDVPGITKWSVDTDNPEKILTVEGSAKQEDIEEAIDDAGFDISLV